MGNTSSEITGPFKALVESKEVSSHALHPPSPIFLGNGRHDQGQPAAHTLRYVKRPHISTPGTLSRLSR